MVGDKADAGIGGAGKARIIVVGQRYKPKAIIVKDKITPHN
jgi:hypothetical protein